MDKGIPTTSNQRSFPTPLLVYLHNIYSKDFRIAPFLLLSVCMVGVVMLTDVSNHVFSILSGSLSDPPNIAGLSHFCEHMLFLGTQKYPKENEYSQFLSEHAGSSNAFTSGEHTNYYFDVCHEHLEGALDR